MATYVGRDLYIGKNTNGKANISNENDVDGSYAVEAEGLTVVNGKLVMKPLKDSWKAPNSSGIYSSAGFRWGTVGFGSQFRPSDRKTVLAVGGANSGINSLSSGNVQGNVGAYGKGGFVGQSYTAWDSKNSYKPVASSAQGYQYKASIAGSETKWSNNTSRSSIVAAQGDWQKNNDVTFNAADPLKDVNGTDYTNYTEANLKTKLSAPLSKLEDTGTVNASGEASEGTATRYKYNYDKTTDPVSFQFTYNGGSTTVDGQSVKNNEKLITFTGDGKSATQVFSLTSEQLSSAGYRGVDFKFVNIPKDASIVINVSGDNIDFHTGWRFWWDKTDIGGGFSKAETDEVRKLYSSVAQKIMWNFKDAKNVTIRGGVANESNSEIDGNYQSKNTTDDPAAAMLGSILVPNGSFESHVSTNGRVYVGQDFMMYNPTAIAYENDKAGWEGKTASVLNMDQERHNLPWNGQMTAKCPAIQWNKANSAGEALKGTTWNVYGTLEAAKAETSSLGTITDGEFTDGNDADGTIKFEGVAKSAKYFVKEFATNSTEYTKVNPYIYQINTGDDEDTHTNIVHVYDADGNEVSGSNADKKLTDSRAIINEKEGATLEWSKVDASDHTKVLSGSEWQLQKNNGSNEAYQITDSTKAVDKVTIQYNGNVVPTEGISLTYNVAVDLTAIVTGTDGGTDGVPQAVKWSSSDPAVASVNDGTVLGLKNGAATITACSVADSAKCATATITVTGAPADTKNTTTFYFKADGYASGNTKLRYRLLPAEGNEGWSTEGTDPVLPNVTNCSGWLSVTIDNPGLKAVEFLFYQGNSWYHSGSASSSSNFTLSAGQSAVAVQDYKAVNGAPSGCSTGGGSGSGGSTTTGTVTISGSTEVGLNKSIKLKATTDPANDTITSWSSGDTSVATVTSDSKNATVVGRKAGRSAITVVTSSNAMASVTITVRDDSTINVYFQKSTVNWKEYYLHYQPKTGTNWPAVKMTDAGDCSGYVVASIPKANVAANHGYYFRNGNSPNSDGWYNSNGSNGGGNSPFQFWGGTYADMYVNTNADKQIGKPSACQVASQSAAKSKASVSAAVLRTRTAVTAINDGSSNTAAATVYACGDAQGKCDMDTRAGYFKVIDLADGTYTLTETVAPNGYTAGGSYTVKIANGTVTITDASENAIAGNEIPNARNTGAISWNKVSSDSQNNKKLGGSEWKLTKTANFVWNTDGKAEYTGIAEDKQLSITITDCKLREGKTCSAPADGQTIYDVDPVEGQFKLEGLEWGTYTLVETKAPDGYDVDSTVRTFTFGPTADTDGTGTWKSNSVESKTGDTTGAFTTSDVEYDSSVFTFSVNGIKNKPGVILPGTGGVGDYWIYAAALVAALIGVVAAGMALKVRRRQ
ncbi:SpaA isopeptide-forming pilin-related protein [Bifidobacterium adolescentis]|uniref:SpaA isopeptide-forming pilin-related protein n=1 Tax=Bifidobacterium adolescentis TaxID=1680 RepID=UPI001898BE0B|nr:SpaA isopeptide-forming pilin-related protein [Bifidobacterium adolescentis]MDB1439430.1 SpaA isopeptide-forming pilin-related protein [Bifidobacterium adolescentis]MDB1441067.1 SpaA isopeptide-forming pilin-related protein [Bifidobacterium adolescentis]MDB1452333.1 SpaA isopeptide-forming pilin-related protein [Bifidobacterium adolescentis]MDB1457831.1 SpaA isopeptide-forming pilin-related protein [Bifidobacterium adolescentis]